MVENSIFFCGMIIEKVINVIKSFVPRKLVRAAATGLWCLKGLVRAFGFSSRKHLYYINRHYRYVTIGNLYFSICPVGTSRTIKNEPLLALNLSEQFSTLSCWLAMLSDEKLT